MVDHDLKQQLIGAINFSLPVIFLYFFYPPLLVNPWGRLLCSLAMGLYIFYLHYRTAKNQIDPLQFIPSQQWKAAFEAEIRACNLDPQKIKLRYGYTNEMIASTTFNTICIDPLIWGNIDQDPTCIQAHTVITNHVLPQLSTTTQKRIRDYKALLSLPAQRFIFKHELGHLLYRYSYKKLIVTGTAAAIATYTALSVVLALDHLTVFAAVLGILTGGLADLFMFKARQEYKADRFAARYSSKEEIIAAADFFEKQQEMDSPHHEAGGLIPLIPSILLRSHYHGKRRAMYLRKLL